MISALGRVALALGLSILLSLVLAMRSGAAPPIALTPGGALLHVQHPNLVDLRFRNVVRQRHDLSCGAAALATLFQGFYGEEFEESDIIEDIFKFGDRGEITRKGFSLLELKRFAERAGYQSAGFRVAQLERLSRLEIPTLALTNVRGYEHFVVIKGVRDGTVFIADPAFGNRAVELERFRDEWNFVLLAVVGAATPRSNRFKLDRPVIARESDTVHFLQRGRIVAPRSPGEFR